MGDYGVVHEVTGEILDDFLSREDAGFRRGQWARVAGCCPKVVRLWQDGRSVRPDGLWKRSEEAEGEQR